MDYLQALAVLSNPEQHQPNELSTALLCAHGEMDRMNQELSSTYPDFKVEEPFVQAKELSEAILKANYPYPATLLRVLPRTLPFYLLGLFVLQRKDSHVPQIQTEDVVETVQGLRRLDDLQTKQEVYAFVDNPNSNKLSPEFAAALSHFRTNMFGILKADWEADLLSHTLGVSRNYTKTKSTKRPL